MILRIETPEHAGARDQARELADPLGPALSGNDVLLDCARLLVGTPSFLDEILKQILVERGADSLKVHGASERVQQLLERSAANRDVRDRLVFAVRS
jgi:hypothetical protein